MARYKEIFKIITKMEIFKIKENTKMASCQENIFHIMKMVKSKKKILSKIQKLENIKNILKMEIFKNKGYMKMAKDTETLHFMTKMEIKFQSVN